MKRDFGPYHHLVYRYHTDLLELWHEASDKWMTDKARINELMKIIPRKYRIEQFVFKKENKKGIHKAMLKAIQRGCWVGVRSCYLRQPLGKAPWIMAMKSKKAINLFLSGKAIPKKKLWLGTQALYKEWQRDPGLKEIIIMFNPPKLCPQFRKDHLVCRIETFEKQLRVELRLSTDQLRDMESDTERRYLINLVMPVKDYLLFEKSDLVASFGRSYFHKDVRNGRIGKIKISMKMLNGDFGGFRQNNHDYTSLIKAEVAQITHQIAQIIFDQWCEAPFNLFYRLQALREFGLGTLEIQGRIEKGKVKYFLVYGLRGTREVSQNLQGVV